MSFFKYPIFMGRKEKVKQLNNLIKHVSKPKTRCPICKFRYRKGESGNSYSIPIVENPEIYPRDYIEGVCPICKFIKEYEKDKYATFEPIIFNNDMEFYERLFLWHSKKRRDKLK